MSDYVLLDGDSVLFETSFTPAVVVAQPGRLSGSGPATSEGKNVCVDGDEGQVSVEGCTYTTAVHTIPGVGALEIEALARNQKANKTASGGKVLLLKGGSFSARFMVKSPAQQPTPGGPVPDATPQYSGRGSFTTMNKKVRAS